MSQSHERTHEATPRRKQRAKERGESPRSALASACFALASAAALCVGFRYFAACWVTAFAGALEHAAAANGGAASLAIMLQAPAYLPLWLPVGVSWASATAGSVLAALLCGGVAIAPQALRPRLSRLSWTAGWKKLASWAAAKQAACAAAALSCLLLSAASAGRGLVAAAAAGLPYSAWPLTLWQGLQSFWSSAVLLLLVVAGADVLLARRSAAANLRMTPREVREERSEFEGRPEHKSRRRSLFARFGRSLRVSAIRHATAIVTNPTRIAIALRYAPPSIDVPLVVARGADMAAALMRSLARLHRIPIVESRELAQLLYFKTDVNEAIPEECYAAVAAVFAWILRTRGTLGGAQSA